MVVPSEEEIRKEIKTILKGSTLASITPKSVRTDLEKLFNVDLTDCKSLIDNLIIQELSDSTANSTQEETANESQKESDEESNADEDASTEPPLKFAKISDEEFARELHARENRSRRSATAKQPVVKKRRVASAGGKEASKKSTFSKDCVLSYELSQVIGKDRCPRFEVVKNMWQYFKDNNLMDPKNKQWVICDDKLIQIFNKKKFKAFGMMKDLKKHIFDASESS